MIATLLSRVRSLWRGVARTHSLDAEMREEFEQHIEMRTADLVRSSFSQAEAERTARAEFGGKYQYTALGREARGLRWFDSLRFSWLDVKLGARMLIKYPLLTLVSALAMGVAIAIGAGGSTVISLINTDALPLNEGDRIVGIQLWDVASWRPERRILRDLAAWRGMRTLQDVGAFRPAIRNIVAADGGAEVGRGVAMSAAGFRLARVQPLLGRYLVDDDERPGAPPVVVIGYDVWRSRFAADSGIVGRTVKLGDEPHTVVGVMPEGFTFPVDFDLWVPLRIDSLGYDWREGPSLFAFGRLAPGATFTRAQAEIETLESRIAKAHHDSHATLRPRVMPFSRSWFELDSPDAVLALRSAQLLMALLLVVICVNVAILVYARTATRQSEIAVRSALGASRGRIITQLFGEASLLSALGAAVGLVIVWGVASRLDVMLAQVGVRLVPFWLRFDVSDTTLVWLLILAAISAFIIGVIPGLQLTGRRVHLNLQRLAGGHATVRMGRMWTALVVIEVAIAVAILPAAVRFAAESIQDATTGPGFAAAQYLSASLAMARPDSAATTPEGDRAFRTHFASARARLERRLEAERDVLAVTFARDVPGFEGARQIEIEAVTAADSAEFAADSARAVAAGRPEGVARYIISRRTRFAIVDADFFRTFGIRVRDGRDFVPADSATNQVIVNRSFVDSFLDGRNALGRRFRTIWLERDETKIDPWLEIVGVVDDFPAKSAFDTPHAATYWVGAANQIHPAMLAVRTRGDPAEFGRRLRAVALDVEPTLLVRDVSPMDAVIRAEQLPLQWLAISLGAVTLSVLILAAAGIYALMSVTVTRRRREIGIRVVLGASRQRLLWGIFMRAAVQLSAGVAVGIGLAAWLNSWTGGELLGAWSVVILPAVSLLAVGVGVLAAMIPARQALGIQPTVVLKEE
ncbi:MAG TPA: ABC transporter permease [Gemmatimonadaceae bacterium]|nr:ABC transporter permease [Gemmatimonadaceae bacterium]